MARRDEPRRRQVSRQRKAARKRDERGSVTAEFAIVLPAVLAVLALAVGAILIATQRAALTATAAEVARLEARGDAPEAAARLGATAGEVRVTRTQRGALHCVTIRSQPAGGLLAAIGVRGEGCAARTTDTGPGP